MATVTQTKAGIDWGKALRWTARFIWAASVLIFKLSLALLSVLATVLIALCLRKGKAQDSFETEEDEQRIASVSFERTSPVNKFAPYD